MADLLQKESLETPDSSVGDVEDFYQVNDSLAGRVFVSSRDQPHPLHTPVSSGRQRVDEAAELGAGWDVGENQKLLDKTNRNISASYSDTKR